ncbi:hypothetical protein BT96DRAFT_857881 [Gymnopus androsaceus JB14]|uniref:Mid2 domain-containing protein n=1 Tax=Gymnopus androsaceus JB14 TaxID=1447944 RepID=A0A6A4HPJ0_9AGAR|nr:hypothetical protein BT96DRAFT_857881 [Gymnopus androsaceus JB14]
MTFYLLLSFLFLVVIFSSPVAALQNLTISWQNSSIVYQQNSSVWSSAPSSLDYSQSHTYTTTKGASASFQFTGVAIYYEAASWPYPVSVNISLDGDSGTFVDLRDYLSPQTPTTGSASVSASTHWYRTGLNNTSHTIVISIPDNATTAVVDALIYSVDTGDSQTGSTIWPIIVGGALGGLVLIGAIVAFIFLYRRRQKKKQEGALWDAPVLENLMTPLISHPAEAFPLVSVRIQHCS